MNRHDENQFDELESELAGLRPVEPSNRLKKRIADRLSMHRDPSGTLQDSEPEPGSARRAYQRGPLWLAAICGPLAACFTFYLLWNSGDKPTTNPDLPEMFTQPTTAAAFDPKLPSLWSYRRAMSQSSQAVDVLLDKHTQHSPEPKPQRAGVYVFARTDSQLETLLGEL